MKGAMLIAMTSLLAAQLVSPGMAQKYSWGGVETSRHDSLLPPRVERVGVRASLLYWGMPSADVERMKNGAPPTMVQAGVYSSPVSTSAGCPRTAEQCG